MEEEATYNWEFSWFYAFVIIGPVLILLLRMIILVLVHNSKKLDRKQKEREKSYRKRVRNSEKALEGLKSKAQTELREKAKPVLASPPPVFTKPIPIKKKVHIPDEPVEHKESFFDKLLGRVPKLED